MDKRSKFKWYRGFVQGLVHIRILISILFEMSTDSAIVEALLPEYTGSDFCGR
jgi:hypothetical protein